MHQPITKVSTDTHPSARKHRRTLFQGVQAAFVACLLFALSSPADAVIRGCEDQACDPPPQPGWGDAAPPVPGTAYVNAVFRPELKEGSALARHIETRRTATTEGSALPNQSLFGTLPGTWDVVSAFVTIPYLFEGTTADHLLVRGLPASALGNSLYQAQGWQRSAYWLDVGDGIPRLLGSELIQPDYVPEPDHPFVDSGDLNWVQLVRYREFGRDYSAYPDEAAFGTLWFVTDPATGDVLDAVIDLYDANGQYEKTTYPFAGDTAKPLLLTYRLSEPEFIYYTEFTDFLELTMSTSLAPGNHVPGVDFIDPFLEAYGFDANRPLELLLEGFRDLGNGEVEWAYSSVFPLGYTWPEARERVFGSGFESLTSQADPRRSGRVVRVRSD